MQPHIFVIHISTNCLHKIKNEEKMAVNVGLVYHIYLHCYFYKKKIWKQYMSRLLLHLDKRSRVFT